MSIRTEYYVVCDATDSIDSPCLNRSFPQHSPVLAALAAVADGWTVQGEGELHICPRHNGNDR